MPIICLFLLSIIVIPCICFMIYFLHMRNFDDAVGFFFAAMVVTTFVMLGFVGFADNPEVI